MRTWSGWTAQATCRRSPGSVWLRPRGQWARGAGHPPGSQGVSLLAARSPGLLLGGEGGRGRALVRDLAGPRRPQAKSAVSFAWWVLERESVGASDSVCGPGRGGGGARSQSRSESGLGTGRLISATRPRRAICNAKSPRLPAPCSAPGSARTQGLTRQRPPQTPPPVLRSSERKFCNPGQTNAGLAQA